VTKDPKKPRDPSDRVARRMLREGRIGQELFDEAMRQRELSGARFEDALIEVGVAEEQVLKMLADLYRVQYISTQKLATASIDKRTLALVPVQIAEQYGAIPVLFDRQKSALTVVMSDPDDVETTKALELATQLRGLRALVARPAAVRAAIEKHYRGDDFPFSMLKNESLALHRTPPRNDEPKNGAAALAPGRPAPPPRAAPPAPVPIPEPAPPPPVEVAPERTRPPALPERAARKKDDIIGDPLKLAIVMVSLLEGNRKDLRGHSIQTSILIRKVAEKLDVAANDARAAEVSGLIHDLGKASNYHLTAYNVARFDGHETVARKLYATPTRVVESAKFAKATTHAVLHMYERYDGNGFPDGLRGADIPIESRILALADSYMDLTNNPRNSFRRVLTPQEACEALRESQGTVFDPKVVDCLSRVVLGDEITNRLSSDRGTVLLVDPDVEETTVIELALLEKRYNVHVARAIDEAERFLESGEVDVIVSEMTLANGTGLDLLARVKRSRNGSNIAFVFLSEEADAVKVAETLDAGAADYLFKPIASQVLVAKVRRIVERSPGASRSRGVSGSLEEMGIPDIVQILHQGRKSGAVSLFADGETGAIYFREGAIVDVVWRGLRGEAAFYALVGISKGNFAIDPTAKAAEETVSASPEMLLLEGMRRLDESSR
jgi:response regulator RpfG family c-di-GMP phosphodiesterase